MAQIKFSVQHNQPLDAARSRLEQVVSMATARFQSAIQPPVWSADRNAVKLSGSGFVIDLSVDARDMHLSADLSGLAALLSSPILGGLKQIVSQVFQKRLE